MNTGRIISVLEPNWTRMKERMASALSSDVALLDDTNRTLLENGGKLLRPMLVLLMAGVCGGVNDRSINVAAASEMLHNASLMHDDVADKSSERRGRPSVMSLLGPSPAVLVGDYWLARSVDMLMKDNLDGQITRLFSKTLENLAEGEMLQMEKSLKGDISEQEYFRIIYCKTASLFESAIVSGAITAGADEARRQAAAEYAESLGMAFQIKDDILDYEGDDSLGKPVGADVREGKITLPLLLAFRGSNRENEIRALMKKAGDKSVAAEIVNFVRENDGITRAEKYLEEYAGKALKALEIFPASEERELLAELARYNIGRTV